LILRRASNIIGPQSVVSISYVSTRGFFLSSGSYLYILKTLIFFLSAVSHLKYFPFLL
jgi:hypothetical protein